MDHALYVYNRQEQRINHLRPKIGKIIDTPSVFSTIPRNKCCTQNNNVFNRIIYAKTILTKLKK